METAAPVAPPSSPDKIPGGAPASVRDRSPGGLLRVWPSGSKVALVVWGPKDLSLVYRGEQSAPVPCSDPEHLPEALRVLLRVAGHNRPRQLAFLLDPSRLSFRTERLPLGSRLPRSYRMMAPRKVRLPDGRRHSIFTVWTIDRETVRLIHQTADMLRSRVLAILPVPALLDLATMAVPFSNGLVATSSLGKTWLAASTGNRLGFWRSVPTETEAVEVEANRALLYYRQTIPQTPDTWQQDETVPALTEAGTRLPNASAGPLPEARSLSLALLFRRWDIAHRFRHWTELKGRTRLIVSLGALLILFGNLIVLHEHQTSLEQLREANQSSLAQEEFRQEERRELEAAEKVLADRRQLLEEVAATRGNDQLGGWLSTLSREIPVEFRLTSLELVPEGEAFAAVMTGLSRLEERATARAIQEWRARLLELFPGAAVESDVQSFGPGRAPRFTLRLDLYPGGTP